VRSDESRVHVDRQALGSAVQLPETLARAGVSVAQLIQERGIGGDLLDDSIRGGVRRHAPEQLLLVAQPAEASQALPAVGHRHRQVAQHPPRVVAAPALLHRRQVCRQRLREPQLVGDLREQRGACVRDQTGSVRRDLYRDIAAIALHLHGDPPTARESGFDTPILQAQPDIPAPRPAQGAAVNAESGLGARVSKG